MLSCHSQRTPNFPPSSLRLVLALLFWGGFSSAEPQTEVLDVALPQTFSQSAHYLALVGELGVTDF